MNDRLLLALFRIVVSYFERRDGRYCLRDVRCLWYDGEASRFFMKLFRMLNALIQLAKLNLIQKERQAILDRFPF